MRYLLLSLVLLTACSDDPTAVDPVSFWVGEYDLLAYNGREIPTHVADEYLASVDSGTFVVEADGDWTETRHHTLLTGGQQQVVIRGRVEWMGDDYRFESPTRTYYVRLQMNGRLEYTAGGDAFVWLRQ